MSEGRSQQAGAWQELLEFYEALCQAARAGHWEKVEKWEAERQRLLDSAATQPPNDADAASLQRLQELNAEIRRLAEAGREDARHDLQGLRNAHIAAQAYLQDSGN